MAEGQYTTSRVGRRSIRTCSDGSTLVALPCAARRRLTGLAIDCGTGGYPCASSDEQNPGACRKPTSTAVECRDE